MPASKPERRRGRETKHNNQSGNFGAGAGGEGYTVAREEDEECAGVRAEACVGEEACVGAEA